MNEDKDIHIGTFIGSLFGNATINVQNNYAQKAEEEPVSPVSFDDAFPEDRERPARMRVWESLRKAGLLDAEYHLAEGVTRAEAKYMAQQIWEKRSPGQKVKWGQFDALWPNCEAKTKLRNESSTLDKEKKQRIDDLIRNS